MILGFWTALCAVQQRSKQEEAAHVDRAYRGCDLADLFLVLKEGTAPKPYPTVAAAKAVGAVTLNYVVFANNIITFLINAAAIFFVVRGINRLRPEPPPAPAPPATKACQFCLSTIPAGAVRCPQCTSDLKTAK